MHVNERMRQVRSASYQLELEFTYLFTKKLVYFSFLFFHGLHLFFRHFSCHIHGLFSSFGAHLPSYRVGPFF